MAEYVVKIVLTSACSSGDLGDRQAQPRLAGAILASLPLTSLLAFVWLYVDTGDTQKVASLATGIFWLVLPCPCSSWHSQCCWHAASASTGLAGSIALTVACYFAMIWVLGRLGIEI